MTPHHKANLLIEYFYQKTPQILGTGKAQELATNMSIFFVKELLVELENNSCDTVDFWNNVLNILETEY